MIVCVKDIDFWKAFRPIKISLDKSKPESQLCKKLHLILSPTQCVTNVLKTWSRVTVWVGLTVNF